MTAESLALNAAPRSREAAAIDIARTVLARIRDERPLGAWKLADKALSDMAELLRDGDTQ